MDIAPAPNSRPNGPDSIVHLHPNGRAFAIDLSRDIAIIVQPGVALVPAVAVAGPLEHRHGTPRQLRLLPKQKHLPQPVRG